MTKFNVTNGELLDLINGLFAVKDLAGKDFSLPVGKNLNILKEALDPLEKLGKPSEEFLELAEKVQAIAERNEDDSLRKEQIEVMKVKMEEKQEVELHLLDSEILPEEITPQQIMNLEKIIT